MKSIILTLAAAAIAAPVYADISNGDGDLYGWAVEDPALLNVKRVPIKDLAYNPFPNDLYGAVYFDPAPEGPGGEPAMGVGDSYGSILHDVDFHW